MSEPIQNRGELNKGEKRLGEFLVAHADAEVFFDAAEEVFDLMATAIVAAMKPGRLAAAPSGRNAAERVLPSQPSPEGVGVEAFIGHATMATQGGRQRCHRVQIMPGTGGQTKAHRSAVSIHRRRQLGVQSALGKADGLCGLATLRVGPVLVQLYVRRCRRGRRRNEKPSQSEP